MHTRRIRISAWVLALIFAAAGAAQAKEGWLHAPFTPLQFAVGPPNIQLFTKDTPVYGMRMTLLWGDQDAITGLDVGLFGDAYKITGIQAGLGNQIKGKLKGVQVGFANSADGGAGVQIGLFNRTHKMRGLQIGLINFNDEGLLPWLPLFNYNF